MTNTDKELKLYTVKIAGKSYSIKSSDSAEHVKRLAVFTDRKLSETLKTSFINREDAAVIAALSLAEELLASQDELTRLRRQLYAQYSEHDSQQLS